MIWEKITQPKDEREIISRKSWWVFHEDDLEGFKFGYKTCKYYWWSIEKSPLHNISLHNKNLWYTQ